MKSVLFAAALALPATGALAADAYSIDESHAAIAFSYNHAGFSTTRGFIPGVTGTILYDAENPAASSVTATIAIASFDSGDEGRDNHFLQSGDFFKLGEFPTATFTSTSIEVTGENTALITGDLSLNGVTGEVVLDTVLNTTTEEYPFPPYQGRAAMGLAATTTLTRSEWNLGLFAPFVGDEVTLNIDLEAIKAE